MIVPTYFELGRQFERIQQGIDACNRMAQEITDFREKASA